MRHGDRCSRSYLPRSFLNRTAVTMGIRNPNLSKWSTRNSYCYKQTVEQVRNGSELHYCELVDGDDQLHCYHTNQRRKLRLSNQY
jgi:hypothetical protein